MTVKDGVLKALEGARGEYVSGEKIAGKLGVSRQAVSKAVNLLSGEGYIIFSDRRKGYLLDKQCDLLSPAVIAAETGTRVIYERAVASTNSLAAAEYLNGGECLAVALSQTDGRRKDGGVFLSPENGGVYCSYAFPASLSLSEIDNFRKDCAEATERVIEECSGKRTERVRLDEFYSDGKKTAGILVEFMLNGAAALTEFAVVGVGIYTGEVFASDIQPVSSNEPRNRMIVSLYRELKKVRDRYAGRHARGE